MYRRSYVDPYIGNVDMGLCRRRSLSFLCPFLFSVEQSRFRCILVDGNDSSRVSVPVDPHLRVDLHGFFLVVELECNQVTCKWVDIFDCVHAVIRLPSLVLRLFRLLLL